MAFPLVCSRDIIMRARTGQPQTHSRSCFSALLIFDLLVVVGCITAAALIRSGKIPFVAKRIEYALFGAAGGVLGGYALYTVAAYCWLCTRESGKRMWKEEEERSKQRAQHTN